MSRPQDDERPLHHTRPGELQGLGPASPEVTGNQPHTARPDETRDSPFPPLPPPRPWPVPLYAPILVAVGGLLGVLAGPLPWVDVDGRRLSGFQLSNSFDPSGIGSGLSGFTLYFVIIAGLVLVTVAAVGILRRDRPLWIMMPGTVVTILLLLQCVWSFVLFSRAPLVDSGVGLWCYVLSGPVASWGMLAWIK